MPLCLLVAFPGVVGDGGLAQLAKLGVNAMYLGVSGSLHSLPVRLATQVSLVSIAGKTDHVTRFAGLDVVVGATVVVAATSGIQERATDTDHDRLDGGQKVWRGMGLNLYPAPRGGPVTVILTNTA
jgi:hypothetical protein